MITTLSQTPNSMRLHIAVFGRRNNGKSSIINAISGQNTALVSSVAGTTTDPVYKPMEIYPLGPCVLIDTAGFDDVGELGEMRIQKTKEVTERTDIALIVFSPSQKEFDLELEWYNILKLRNIPVIGVINKIDKDNTASEALIKKHFNIKIIKVSALTGEGIDNIRNALIEAAPADYELSTITGHLCGEGDSVLLVMPQDIQAPKGRLILPQVQVIRDLLDLKAVVTSVTTDKLIQALAMLKEPPKLIITDSQVFSYVYEHTPRESMLTSFSVLMARYKGDIDVYKEGAEQIDNLKDTDKVLIAEACTHKPLDGDIARVKIPNMLRKKIGQSLQIDIVSGNDFPKNIKDYSLIIHCGGCMFNRKYVLSRIAICKEYGVPITNYGIAIAKMTGILDKIRTNK